MKALQLGSEKENSSNEPKNDDDLTSLMKALQNGSDDVSPNLESEKKKKKKKKKDDENDDLNDLSKNLDLLISKNEKSDNSSGGGDLTSLMKALQNGSNDVISDLGSEKENDLSSIMSFDENANESKIELVIDDSLFKDQEALKKDESAVIRLNKMISKAENLLFILDMKKTSFASRGNNASAMGSEAGISSSSSNVLSQKSGNSKRKKK